MTISVYEKAYLSLRVSLLAILQMKMRVIIGGLKMKESDLLL